MAFEDRVIKAELYTSLPLEFRDPDRRSGWIDANKPGAKIDSFLEGPTVAPDGALWVTDIPHGRIFRIDPSGQWSLAAEYDGWPNGMRWHSDGHLYIADYKRGILRLRAGSNTPEPVFETFRSESFKGCNDLWFAADGTLFFTDQGQTGLHDPSGRVYRADTETQVLDVLLSNGPSPNGLVGTADGKLLFVAMTRSCEVWRLPLFPNCTSKVQLFARIK
jgi:gluconolactonase